MTISKDLPAKLKQMISELEECITPLVTDNDEFMRSFTAPLTNSLCDAVEDLSAALNWLEAPANEEEEEEE